MLHKKVDIASLTNSILLFIVLCYYHYSQYTLLVIYLTIGSVKSLTF